jgi:FkbM family methyltransferase
MINRFLYRFFGGQITYSQCGEDIILSHIFRNIFKLSSITYLDIGCNDPRKANNTFLFYKQGSKGVLVEPNPQLINTIRSTRPNDTCLNVGIGIEDESEMDLYVLNPHTLSTFDKKEAEELIKNGAVTLEKVAKIPVLNINSIMNKHFDKSPDLISIDVEGLNEEIFHTIDFQKYRPKVICMESIAYNAEGIGTKIKSILDKMEKENYFLYADTYLNSIYIDKKSMI